MDFTPTQISIEVVIHTNVPLYFHLLSPCVKCYCLKTDGKMTTHCTNGLGEKNLFLKKEKRRWSVIKMDNLFLLLKYFANLIVQVAA